MLSLYNAANAAAMTLGTLLGAAAFGGFAGSAGNYTLVMAVSALARFAAVPFLRHAPETPAPAEPVAEDALSVQPGAGAVATPVLATIPELEKREAQP